MHLTASHHSNLAFCSSLIGKPWVAGGRGPEVFDCWGLLVFAYRELLGIELPAFTCIDVQNKLQVSRTIADGFYEWNSTPSPHHLCAVGISANKRLHHLGLWLDVEGGGVLHAVEHTGVVFQSTLSLRQAGLQNLQFYTYKRP